MSALCRYSMLSLALTYPALLNGQCSDAGVCSLGKVAPSNGNRLALAFQLGASGKGDNLTFRTLRLDGQVGLGPATRVVFSLPATRVQGPKGSTSGLGDLVLALDHTVLAREGWSFALQAGARLATGRDNGEETLPQAYQTGLGPADALAGLRLELPRWAFGVGYQKAGGRSANPVTRLRRGDDALVWAEGWSNLGETRLALKALAIQRLSLSSRQDPDTTAERFVDVPGSNRLQVNLLVSASHPLSRSLNLEASAGLPLLRRPANDDGLKRSYTASLGMAWRF